MGATIIGGDHGADHGGGHAGRGRGVGGGGRDYVVGSGARFSCELAL